MFAGDIVHHLQGALDGALSGVEYEDQGDAHAAVSSVQSAIGRMRYAMEFMVMEQMDPLQPMVHVVCEALLNTYIQYLQVLKTDDVGQSTSQLHSPRNLHIQHRYNEPEHPSMACGANHTALAVQAKGRASSISPTCKMGRQHGKDQEKLAGVLETCLQPVSGSLDDLAGLQAVKEELREAVYLPMLHPDLFNKLRRPPSNFLLHGPPGTGKTTLVRKMAAEAGLPLLAISPSSILSKWAGDSEKMLQSVFAAAKKLQPAVVFIDEIDSLAASRGGPGDDQMSRRLLTELLLQLTDVHEGQLVFVFAATNRMQDCDPAVIRRFHRRIEIPIPDTAARREYFACLLAQQEISCKLEDTDLDALAALTHGYSSSDLEHLVQAAAMTPVREFCQINKGNLRASVQNMQARGGAPLGDTGVTNKPVVLRTLLMADFAAAAVHVKPSLSTAAHPVLLWGKEE